MFFQIARRRRCTTPAPEPLRGFQFPRDGNLCQKDSDSEEATKHFFVNQGQGESEKTSIKFKSVISNPLLKPNNTAEPTLAFAMNGSEGKSAAGPVRNAN